MSTEVQEKAEIVVVGSCMIDLVSYVPRLPNPGETVQGTKFVQGWGGKGANQCVAAAKLGATTALVAKLGNDSFGASYLSELDTYKNLNTRFVTREENMSSGMASISVSDSGENQIVIVPGANSSLCETDIDNAFDLIANCKVVLFQGETPWSTTRYCLERLAKTNVVSIVNVAPAPTGPLSEDLYRSLTLASIVCVNELEAEQLTQEFKGSVKLQQSINEQSINELLDLGCKTVIVTLGPSGAAFATSEERRVKKVPVSRVEHPVDTTGAGDCFLGALAYFMFYFTYLSLEDQIAGACKVARESVKKQGTQSSFPTGADFTKLAL